MSKALTHRLDPLSAADKGRIFDGTYPLSAMNRLVSLLIESSGEVRYRVQFVREGGHSVLRGGVSAELIVECQCCLQAMTLLVDQKFALAVVESLDQVDALPDGLEPLLVESVDPTVSVLELVEDELLLAVPYVVQHPECAAIRDGKAADGGEPAKPRAFAGLASLVQLKKQ